MQQVIDNCNNCQQEKPIINKKYYLCQECNWQRLHPNEDQKEKQEQQKQNLIKKKVKNSGKLKSAKNTYLCSDGSRVTQPEIENKLKQVYNQIDKVREPICESCGTNQNLSHSHIISRRKAKEIGKTDLIWDENNILIECYGSKNACHNLTEKGLEFCRNHFTFEYKKSVIEEYLK